MNEIACECYSSEQETQERLVLTHDYGQLGNGAM